jgi:hypothetical protein
VLGHWGRFQSDPYFKDYVLFYEYFHGDSGRGVGAAHQTGWTGLIAKLLQPRGERLSQTAQKIDEETELIGELA